jgi:hypothetical protein
LRAAKARSDQRKDEAVISNFLVEHDQAERERHEPAPPLPSGRTNTDWTYIPPG